MTLRFEFLDMAAEIDNENNCDGDAVLCDMALHIVSELTGPAKGDAHVNAAVELERIGMTVTKVEPMDDEEGLLY